MAQQKEYKPGDSVEVNWIGSWVPGKIDKCLNASTCMVYFYDAAHARYETNSSAIMMDHIRVATGQPRPLVATADVKFTVGQRVEYINDGKWYKAIIIKVRDDSAEHLDGKIYAPYRVHPLGYNQNEDSWVCCIDIGERRSQLRPAGSGPTEPVPGGEANDAVLKAMLAAKAGMPPARAGTPPVKQYKCVYFIVDHLVDAAPFTLTGASTYKDSVGKSGTYTFNQGSSTLTFHGGNYDGQSAEYETTGGGARLHILGKTGRRIIDCD